MAKKKKDELMITDTKKDNILLEEKLDKETLCSELKDYVDERINHVFVEELEKTNKKLIREKSRRIFWKNVIIILLLLVVGFLVYLLYSNNYFDKYFNKDTNWEDKENQDKKDNKEENKEEKEEDKEENKEEKVPTLDELKEKYAYLLNNYYVTDSSVYLNEFYNGKLTNDLMKYMTLNSFNFATFEKEEDYNIIKESTFKMMFEKLFDSEYTSATFNYDDNKVRYVKQIEAYMTESLLVRENSNIKREIKDIKVDGEKIIITTVEGVVKDKELYNVLSNDLIGEYQDGSIIKYADKLNQVIYVFENEKLVDLSK